MTATAAFSLNELQRYSQQLSLAEIGLAGQEKLKNGRVLCIGVGGLGSVLALYLAAAGVGTLGLVDDDEVALSNLHRQILYRPSDLRKKKTKRARDALLDLNPHIEIQTYPLRLTKDNAQHIISQYDIVADGSDNFATRILTHDICHKLKKPYVYASVSQFKGQCTTFLAKKDNPCLHCLFPNLKEAKPANCSAGGIMGVLPGILGTIQAAEILKWILQIGNVLEKRLLVVDVLEMRFKEIHLKKNEACGFCVG